MMKEAVKAKSVVMSNKNSKPRILSVVDAERPAQEENAEPELTIF